MMIEGAPIQPPDEATNVLERAVEAAIQQCRYTRTEGKAAVGIAQRLSTIAALDCLMVMDAGPIAEQGSPARLLVAGGIPARPWAHQSGRFLGLDAQG